MDFTRKGMDYSGEEMDFTKKGMDFTKKGMDYSGEEVDYSKNGFFFALVGENTNKGCVSQGLFFYYFSVLNDPCSVSHFIKIHSFCKLFCIYDC